MADGGPFLLVWGLWATSFGWIVATNFRGAARRMHLHTMQLRPERLAHLREPGLGFLRAVAGVFALVGPVILAQALNILRREGWHLPGMPEQPIPFTAWAGVVVVFWMWMFWRRSGFLRMEWSAGALPQRAAVGVLSAAFLVMPFAMSIGLPAVLLICWLTCLPAGLYLLTAGRAEPNP